MGQGYSGTQSGVEASEATWTKAMCVLSCLLLLYTSFCHRSPARMHCAQIKRIDIGNTAVHCLRPVEVVVGH